MQTLSSDTVAAYYDRFRDLLLSYLALIWAVLGTLSLSPSFFFFTRGPQHDPNGPLLLDIRL